MKCYLGGSAEPGDSDFVMACLAQNAKEAKRMMCHWHALKASKQRNIKMTEAQLIAKRADHKTSHILHLFLSVITAGIWIPFWIIVTVSHSLERKKIDKKLGQIGKE